MAVDSAYPTALFGIILENVTQTMETASQGIMFPSHTSYRSANVPYIK